MPAGPGQIIGSEVDSVTGAVYMANVGSDGRLWVDVGGDIVISGETIDNVVVQQVPPTDSTKNNPVWWFNYSGTVIGSVFQNFNGVTYGQSITYSGNGVGSLSAWAVI